MKYILFFMLLISSLALAGDDYLLFKPLTANIFEPRIGSFYQLRDDKLRLDIGASFDLYRNSHKMSDYAIGADFFTYTRLRHSGKFKFPVETSDYFFGVNYSQSKLFSDKLSTRIRLAHISSHLVDGYTIPDTMSVFQKEPYTYSHEFIDVVVAYSDNYKKLNYRAYSGVTYNFSKLPKSMATSILQLGADFTYGGKLSLVGGIDGRFRDFQFGSDSYYVTAQLGPQIKLNNQVGLFVGYYGYAGKSFHGMFFEENDFYNGIGFQITYF